MKEKTELSCLLRVNWTQSWVQWKPWISLPFSSPLPPPTLLPMLWRLVPDALSECQLPDRAFAPHIHSLHFQVQPVPLLMSSTHIPIFCYRPGIVLWIQRSTYSINQLSIFTEQLLHVLDASYIAENKTAFTELTVYEDSGGDKWTNYI